MIITIDGPCASGKSSIANLLAQKLGIFHLNSGLLFRGLAHILLTDFDYSQEQLAHPKQQNIMAITQDPSFGYSFRNGTALLCYKDCDLTPFLKTPRIDQAASLLSTSSIVREELLQFQRTYAKTHSVVVDGRDAGSIVFPHADIKFYLTASPEIRAERWRLAHLTKGKQFTPEQALQEINERDKRDTERAIAPLIIAPGAIVIDNSNMDINQTLDALLKCIQ